MRSTVIRTITTTMLAATAALSATATHAGSIQPSGAIFISPNDTPGMEGGTASVGLFMDFGSIFVIGGQILIDITGPITISSFTPTDYFNSLLTGISTSFGATGNLPADAEFQVSITAPFILCGPSPCPSLITGQQKLGDLNFDVGGIGQGVIDLSEGDLFGSRGESFAEDLTGSDIAMGFFDGTITAVPLPTSAWLFATGMGLAAFWRRRRA